MYPAAALEPPVNHLNGADFSVDVSVAHFDEIRPLLPKECRPDTEHRERGAHPLWESPDELYGYLLMAGASLNFTLATALIHFLGSPSMRYDIDPVFMTWARSLFLIGSATIYIANFTNYRAVLSNMDLKVRCLLVLRGFSGALSILTFGFALVLLPLGEAVSIYFLAPIFTLILASIALGETVTIVEGCASLSSFVGVALVTLPSSNSDVDRVYKGLDPVLAHVAGVAFAVISAATNATGSIIVRRIRGKVPSMFNVLSMGLGSCCVSSLCMGTSIPGQISFISGKPVAIILLVGQALLAVAAQSLVNEALQHCRSSGVLIRNVEVLFSYVVGISVFGEIPSAASGAGAIVILISVLAITIRQAAAPKHGQQQQECNAVGLQVSRTART